MKRMTFHIVVLLMLLGSLPHELLSQTRPYDRRFPNGKFVQDFEQDHNFVFSDLTDRVPVYIRITHRPVTSGHHSYDVHGAVNTYAVNNQIFYGAQLPDYGGYHIQVTEHLLPKTPMKPLNDTKRRWPSISVSDPLPLFVNRFGNRVKPEEKKNPGIFIGVNDNDDDQDGIIDLNDPQVVGETSLVAIEIVHPKGIPVQLSWDNSILHLYETPNKAYGNSETARVSRIGNNIKHDAYKGKDDQIIYIEGISPGTTDIVLTGPGGLSDRLKINVVKVDMAMDGNRDDSIDFGNQEDKKYVFWINSDFDVKHRNEGIWQQDDQVGDADANDDFIGNSEKSGENGCERDLEDFTRLHVLLDEYTASLPGVTYHLRIENITAGSPSVNIFKAVDPGSDYLSDEFVAESQLIEKRILTVDSREKMIDDNNFLAGDRSSPFLLEGRGTGAGDLAIIIRVDGNEVYKKAVALQLNDIEWFYNVYRTQVTSGERWEIQVDTTATQVLKASYLPSTDENFLLVHGWNMTEEDKSQWIQTTFKRLWWQGYRGSVSLFSWPTLAEYSGFWTIVTQTRHYDNSEFRSWLSADALIGVIDILNSNGNLRLLAHSMGNVATGEALRRYNGTHKIHSYFAAQAALSAHFYDNTIATTHPVSQATYAPPFYYPLSTPDIAGHFHSGDTSANPFLDENNRNIARMFNYFNPEDWALDLWEQNNVMKPDGFAPYLFGYTGRKNFYEEGVDLFFRGAADAPTQIFSVFVQRELYQVFSYIVESPSVALGQAHNNEFAGWNLENELNYDGEHYSHSREFRSHLPEQWGFWSQLMEDGLFDSTHP